jgi:hypothetical protein
VSLLCSSDVCVLGVTTLLPEFPNSWDKGQLKTVWPSGNEVNSREFDGTQPF